MNGKYHSGSGRVVTFTYDTPFIKDSLSHLNAESNEEIVNNEGEQLSERTTHPTAHDIMGEKARLEKRYAKLKVDFEAYKKQVKLDKTLTRGKIMDIKQLEMVARYLVKEGDSTYKVSDLVINQIELQCIQKPQNALSYTISMCKCLLNYNNDFVYPISLSQNFLLKLPCYSFDYTVIRYRFIK